MIPTMTIGIIKMSEMIFVNSITKLHCHKLRKGDIKKAAKNRTETAVCPDM